MINVVIHTNPVNRTERERHVVAWREGLTYGDLIPSNMDGIGGIVPYSEGAAMDLGDPVRDGGDVVLVVNAGVEALIINFLISTAVSFVIRALLPPPKAAKKRGDEGSPTYGFGGIANSRTEGLPIPVTYGTMRVGGQVIAEWKEVFALPATTTLFILIHLGEGPNYAIGGITEDNATDVPLLPNGVGIAAAPELTLIDGNDATNFSDIEMHVRMGTQSQDPIPGFTQVKQEFAVGQALNSTETTAADNSAVVTTDPYGTGDDALWTEYAVGYTLTEVSDSYIVRLRFPNGLYSQSGGGLTSSLIGAQVRYRQLDGGGSPITTGGPNGDGWVRAKPLGLVAAAQRSAFEIELRGDFLDKDSWVVPVDGKLLRGDGASGSFARATRDASSTFEPLTTSPGSWTFETWLKIPAGELPVDGSVADGAEYFVCGDYDDTLGGGKGMGWEIVARHYHGQQHGSAATPIYTWSYWLRVNDGVSAGTHNGYNQGFVWPGQTFGGQHLNINGPFPFTRIRFDTWQHLVFTQEIDNLNDPATQRRYRVFLDGQMIIDSGVTSYSLFMASGDMYWFGHPNTAANNPAHVLEADFDDTIVTIAPNGGTGGAWSPALVLSRFNARLGVEGVPGTQAGVGHWKWDAAGSPSSEESVGGFFGDATLNGGVVAGVTGGLMSTTSFGDRRRGQYLVEALRTNVDSTHASTVDEVEVEAVVSVLDVELRYPNSTLVGVKIRATEQLNTTQPELSFLLKGRAVPVWDGESIAVPTIARSHSSNPAWCALDLILSKEYGLGTTYSIDRVDLLAFRAWADYCDEVVWDGRPKVEHTTNVEYIHDDIRWFSQGVEATDPVTGEVRGALWMYIARISQTTGLPRFGDVLPEEFRIGGFVRLENWPASGVDLLTNDLDSPEGTGYEIHDIVQEAVQWVVKCWWDRTDETEPWEEFVSGSEYLIADGIVTPEAEANGAFYTTGQHRFALNGIFDETRTAWDALIEICAVGRAVPVQRGSVISVKYSHPRSPDVEVGMGSYIKGSFEIEYEGPEQRDNSIDIGFLDADDRHERAIEIVNHKSIKNPASLVDLRRDQTFVWGVTDRAQIIRHGNFSLNVNNDLIRQGRFKMAVDSIAVEPGDIARIAHDIVPRGVSGRILSDAASTTTATLDRDFVIDGVSEYYLFIQVGEASHRHQAKLTTGGGSYAAGTTVTLDTTGGWTALPAKASKDDAYILVRNGDELLVEVTSTEQLVDMTKSIQFIEYNASIYVDDVVDPITVTELIQSGVGGDDVPGDDRVTPGRVRGVTTDDRYVAIPGGVRAVLFVSWAHDPATVVHHARTNVLTREDGAQWEIARTVEGNATSARVPLDAAVAGSSIDVAIQPVTHRGAFAIADNCGRATHTVVGIGPYPDVPTNVAADMQGDQVIYSWGIPATANRDTYVVEIRRGGWIAAPVVFVSQPGTSESPPLSDWSIGDLYFRARNTLGQYSEHATITFTPDVLTDTSRWPGEFGDNEWSTYANGWKTDSAPPTGDPALSNLQRHADGWLEFSAGVSATYTTAETGTRVAYHKSQPRRCYVEASVAAEQISPIHWGAASGMWGDPLAVRATWEGPTHVLPNETANATIGIEARINTTGASDGWQAWREFKPGLYSFVDIQFRIVATRPDTTYDVRIHSFRTRVRVIAATLHDMTSARRFLLNESF